MQIKAYNCFIATRIEIGTARTYTDTQIDTLEVQTKCSMRARGRVHRAKAMWIHQINQIMCKVHSLRVFQNCVFSADCVVEYFDFILEHCARTIHIC